MIEFYHVKFPASILSEDAFGEKFLGLTVTICFQNNECFKVVNFLSVNSL